MAKILDIPDEVLDIIFNCLVTETLAYTKSYYRSARMRVSKEMAKKMRLVCRKWADWFCSNYLFDSLTFSRKRAHLNNELIAHLSTPRSCGSADSLASTIRCRYLSISNLHPPRRILHLRKRTRRDEAIIAWEVLESLVLFFQHSLIELELHFVDYLLLPDSTIEAIGRIKNLRTLRLGILFANGSDLSYHVVKHRRPDTRPDTECLRSLLLAAQGLETLDLENFNPMVLSGRLQSGLCNRQLPALKHLDLNVDLDWQCLEGYMSLAIALQHTIKVLSVGGDWYRDGDWALKRVLETLRESLEGLRVEVDNEEMLAQLSDVHFPNLRVLRIDNWNGCFATLLFSGHFFFNAPIEVIVIDEKGCRDCSSKLAFPSHPFRKIPTLRRLVFVNDSPDDYWPAEPYILACKNSGVQWLVRRQEIEVSDIMEL